MLTLWYFIVLYLFRSAQIIFRNLKKPCCNDLIEIRLAIFRLLLMTTDFPFRFILMLKNQSFFPDVFYFFLFLLLFVWSFSLFAYLKTTLYSIPLITFCSSSFLDFATLLIEVHPVSLSNILHLTIQILFRFLPMIQNYRFFVFLLGFVLDFLMRILNSVI